MVLVRSRGALEDCAPGRRRGTRRGAGLRRRRGHGCRGVRRGSCARARTTSAPSRVEASTTACSARVGYIWGPSSCQVLLWVPVVIGKRRRVISRASIGDPSGGRPGEGQGSDLLPVSSSPRRRRRVARKPMAPNEARCCCGRAPPMEGGVGRRITSGAPRLLVERTASVAFHSMEMLWATRGRLGRARGFGCRRNSQLRVAQTRMTRRVARWRPHCDQEYPVYAQRTAAQARSFWDHMGIPQWEAAVAASSWRWAARVARLSMRDLSDGLSTSFIGRTHSG